MGREGEERELATVRRRLDSLTAQRLGGPLDFEARRLYEALCALEKRLLNALHGCGTEAGGEPGGQFTA